MATTTVTRTGKTQHFDQGRPHMGHPHKNPRAIMSGLSNKTPASSRAATKQNMRPASMDSRGGNFPEPMAFNNLATAIATLHAKNGHALPNRFEVMIYPPSIPPALKAIGGASDVSLRCETILLPGRNLNTGTDGNPYGPTREIVDGVTYAEDIAMTFVSSAGLEERVFFEEWQELAFNKKTWNVGYYDDYVGTVEIYILNRQDERRYGIKLIEAFPKTISGTDLSQAANNEIIKTSVSFSFRYWETLDQNRSTSDRAGRLPATQSEKIFNAAAKPATRNLSSNMPTSVSRLGGSGGNVAGAY